MKKIAYILVMCLGVWCAGCSEMVMMVIMMIFIGIFRDSRIMHLGISPWR
ncbi:MAG: hypothetical protein ACLU4J_25820 [Butyricimonas paravirosa]